MEERKYPINEPIESRFARYRAMMDALDQKNASHEERLNAINRFRCGL